MGSPVRSGPSTILGSTPSPWAAAVFYLFIVYGRGPRRSLIDLATKHSKLFRSYRSRHIFPREEDYGFRTCNLPAMLLLTHESEEQGCPVTGSGSAYIFGSLPLYNSLTLGQEIIITWILETSSLVSFSSV